MKAKIFCLSLAAFIAWWGFSNGESPPGDGCISFATATERKISCSESSHNPCLRRTRSAYRVCAQAAMTLWTCNVTDRLLIVLIVCTRWSSGILSGIGNFVFRLWSAGGLDLNICPGVPEFLVTPPVVLQWFSSYLYGRTFKSSMDWGSTSSAVYIPCSIPQGSVLGPPHLFILCSVHGVSWRPRDGINMSSVSTRSPTTRRRRDVCHCTTRELHRGSQPLDVC